MLDSSLFSEEEQYLYNPAFVGFILHSSVVNFTHNQAEGMHYALAYIVVPMAMNPYITTSLPRGINTPISTWISAHEGLLSDFPEHANAYIEITTAAISFLLHRNLIQINDLGYITTTQTRLRIPKKFTAESPDISSILKSSKFLGKWFSQTQSPETIFIQLGIRP